MASEIEILSSALEQPHGVLVATNDFTLARQRLYKVRAAHPEFAGLEVRQGAEPNTLWVLPAGQLVKRASVQPKQEDVLALSLETLDHKPNL